MKKATLTMSSLILVVMLIISMMTFSISSASAETLLRGDVNLSGKIEISDATILQQSLAKMTTLSDSAATCADIDGDGKITVADASLLQSFLASISDKYGIGQVITTEETTETEATETTEATEAATTWEDNTGTIVLSDSGIKVTGNNISVSGNVVTITDGGDWTVTGSCSDGMIYVDTGETKDDNDKVKLRLSGMSLTNTSGPAIYFDRCKKAFLTLTEGTTNYVEDGSSYSTANSEAKGAVHSDDTLEIKGKGTLNVTGNYKHAINSDDDIEIGNGVLNLTANVGDGMHANDAVFIDGKNINITIDAAAEGIQSEDVNYTTEPEESGINIASGTISIKSVEKGILSDQLVNITGGTITVNATDDAIHSNNDVEISGGALTLSSGDDGIHSDTILNIVDGTIKINKSYEGIESYDINVSGGSIYIVSSDDAMNGAGGNDASGGESYSIATTLAGPGGAGGPGGGNSGPGGEQGGGGGFNPGEESSSSGSIEISGGEIYAVAGGDGLDSNGAFTISGGTTIVQQSSGGNCCVDADSGITYTGGTLLAMSPSSAMWTDVRVNGSYTLKTSAGSVSKNSVIAALSGSTVLTAVKSQLSGTIGILYMTDAVSSVSSIKYNIKGTYSGSYDSLGVGTGGSISGGTTITPSYYN